MRTTILKSDDQLIGSICVKNAESKYDKKMLLKINKNINFINHHFPEFMQEVMYLKENEIGLKAAPGVCLFSPDAFIEYPQNEWIVESIVTYLNVLQNESVIGSSEILQRMELIKPIVKGLLVGCKYPLTLVKHIFSIL